MSHHRLRRLFCLCDWLPEFTRLGDSSTIGFQLLPSRWNIHHLEILRRFKTAEVYGISERVRQSRSPARVLDIGPSLSSSGLARNIRCICSLESCRRRVNTDDSKRATFRGPRPNSNSIKLTANDKADHSSVLRGCGVHLWWNLRGHLELCKHFPRNSRALRCLTSEPHCLRLHCIRVTGRDCYWRLDPFRADKRSLSHLLPRCFLFRCGLHTAFRERDSCYHDFARHRILDFCHVSFDLHGVVALPGFDGSTIWTIFRSSLLRSDDRRVDSGIG